MTTEETGNLAELAMREADNGNTLIALVHLEKVLHERKSPLLNTYFAYCLAKERKEYPRALTLCREAIEGALPLPALYLNLGRTYLAAGYKRQALNAFRRGLKFGGHPLISAEMRKLGMRKNPVIPLLPRDNLCNKYLGLLLKRLTLR
jgi:tetratricopeptide (TPR) repeat protein